MGSNKDSSVFITGKGELSGDKTPLGFLVSRVSVVGPLFRLSIHRVIGEWTATG